MRSSAELIICPKLFWPALLSGKHAVKCSAPDPIPTLSCAAVYIHRGQTWACSITATVHLTAEDLPFDTPTATTTILLLLPPGPLLPIRRLRTARRAPSTREGPPK